jgi:precorrin-2/cobalt-factor-2 C20-methyltransferase
MRDNNKKIDFYGVGIGPGDPGLVTIKAKNILDKIDTVFVPSADGEKSFAFSIISSLNLKNKKFVILTFPMTKDKKILRNYWVRAAKKIRVEIQKNKTTAFVTIGDPFIYSTYIYVLKELKNRYPDIKVETIPGITSFNAASCACGLPLLESGEKMAVLPVSRNFEGLEKILKEFDTVVLMKVGPKIEKITCLLKRMNLIKNAVLISHVGHKNEKIIRDFDNLNKKEGYLSVVIVKKEKKK